jgi:hypothetical protein
MIDNTIPADWRELQDRVARILQESGLETEVEKRLDTVRGRIEVDVLAIDVDVAPQVTYICECKLWNRPIPREIVHSFRTVVGDFGANAGILVSREGFQSGAVEAAKNTNVILTDWFGFQKLFLARWHSRFAQRLFNIAHPLSDYTQPMTRYFDKKAAAIPNFDCARYDELRAQFTAFALVGIMPHLHAKEGLEREPILPIPVSRFLRGDTRVIGSYRQFEEFYGEMVEAILSIFDELFGEEIRNAPIEF